MQHPDETTDPIRTANDPQPTGEATPGAASQGPDQPSASTQRTGLPAADRVLEAVAGLDDRPVDDHVAVFEQAHDQLRRALDARPDS